jgi:outer membrane receptor protein involved in Fe transport
MRPLPRENRRRRLRADHRDLEGAANIENVFNKGYWASADGNNNLSPGQPRTFRLKVTAKP